MYMRAGHSCRQHPAAHLHLPGHWGKELRELLGGWLQTANVCHLLQDLHGEFAHWCQETVLHGIILSQRHFRDFALITMFTMAKWGLDYIHIPFCWLGTIIRVWYQKSIYYFWQSFYSTLLHFSALMPVFFSLLSSVYNLPKNVILVIIMFAICHSVCFFFCCNEVELPKSCIRKQKSRT